MKAFAYLRVSGDSQIEGDGFTRQLDSVSKFCTHIAGLELAGEYVEAGVSGTVEGTKRPAMMRLLVDLAAQPEADRVVVVERLDRLARDLMAQECILREFRDRGIKLFCADQGNTQDMASNHVDPTRKLIRQIMGALAEWEKSALVAKLKASRDRVRAETGRCEGVKPYGQRPGEDAVLEIIHDMKHAGATHSTIAAKLNRNGLARRNGEKWNRKSVARLAQKMDAEPGLTD